MPRRSPPGTQPFREVWKIKTDIDLYIGTGTGETPLDERTEALALPQNPAFPGPSVAYGPYLRAVAGYFSAHSRRRLKDLLSRAQPSAPPLGSAESIALVAEKHGALYSVSRLVVRFPSEAFSFAVNAAFLPEQRAFLAVEYRLLRDLNRRFHRPGVPMVWLSGKTQMKTGGSGDLADSNITVSLFAAEWIENHHEFHLSGKIPGEADSGASLPRLHVWKPGSRDLFLDERRSVELYEGAARILTTCLDSQNFRQIYPWHHAAGDFIIDESTVPVSVRLITARDYRSLLPAGSDTSYKMLGSLHFFINLGLRMRIDRLDGTGPLAWAGTEAIEGAIRGFCSTWGQKELDDPELPGASDIFSFFLGLTEEERLDFTEIAARDGRVEAEETTFLRERLPAHVRELSAAIENYLETLENE